jgi:hypothetical protein
MSAPSRRRFLAAGAGLLAAGAGVADAATTAMAPVTALRFIDFREHGIGPAAFGEPPDAVPWVNPDAALIALCEEFGARERAGHALFEEPLGDESAESREAAGAQVWRDQAALSRRILASRAQTVTGVAAIAHAWATHAGCGEFSMDPCIETTTGRLTIALLRETLRLHGDVVPDALLEGGEA